jgi:hypothetical protein
MRLNATRLGSIASSRSFGDQLDDLAGQVPGLDLNFAQNKSLIDDYSGTTLVTFTRASAGRFVGSDGLIQTAAVDAPRFDHNPTTGESLGLLVEEARTNLVLRSEELDNASWTRTGATVSTNTVVAPDGTTTADTLIETTSTGNHNTLQSITAAISTVYTFSVFAKAASGTRTVRLLVPTVVFGTAGSCVFNLQTGTAGSLSGAITAANITAFPDGWYRCAIVTSASTAGVVGNFTIGLIGTGASYTGDGTSGVYLWGAQLEAGAFPTSYIPTTTATATRAADVASITGSNFSSWYNQTEGTVFVDASGVNNINVSTRAYVEIRDASSSERILLGYGTTSNNRFLVGVSGGATAADITVASLPTAKATGAYKVNSFQLASNNILGTEDVVGLVPTVTQLQIGSQDGSTANTFINGTIKRLTYWPTRLANTTLQQITQS